MNYSNILLLTSFVSFVSSHRYENVDCTIILEGSIDRTGPFNIDECYTSLSPFNNLSIDSSYCITVLSNNTEPIRLETTTTYGDFTVCLAISSTTSDSAQCNWLLSDCDSYDYNFYFCRKKHW